MEYIRLQATLGESNLGMEMKAKNLVVWEGFMLTKPEKVMKVASTSPPFPKPEVNVLQPP